MAKVTVEYKPVLDKDKSWDKTILTITVIAEQNDRLEDIQRLVKMMSAVIAGVWQGQAVTLTDQTDPALLGTQPQANS